MNKRMKIGIDIDGVLIDTDSRAYLEFCERELGWDVDIDKYMKTHSWGAAVGAERRNSDDLDQAFEKFVMSVEESQHPIQGAHDALKKISEVGDIFLITARTGLLREVTDEYLSLFLPDVMYEELSMDNMEKKVEKILEFEVDYYIDDSFREVSLVLADSSVQTKVIPFPPFHGTENWKKVHDERIHWLSVWDDVEDGLDKEEQKTIHKRAWDEIAEIITQDV